MLIKQLRRLIMNGLYTVVYGKYTDKGKEQETDREFDSFKEAIIYAKGIQLPNWTRHSSVLGPVQHMDKYFDLYNEGYVIIN